MSGRIPQNFIDDLVARADIIEVLGSRMELRKAGREYKALCPFHGEKSPSFTVSPDKGFYHCFGCGAHGTALGFLMEHDHLSFVDAVEELASMMSVEVPRETGGAPRDGRIDQLYALMDRVADCYSAALKNEPKAVEYLKQRGIDGSTARDFRIGYAPDAWDRVLTQFSKSTEDTEMLQAAGMIIQRDSGGHYDRFRDRLMFPIRDSRGRIVGFGGRVLDKGEPKYLNSPETVIFHKGRELYGLYEARQKLRDITQLVVVEGYMDVVGLARYGIHFSVATLGTATTPDHIERLFRLCDTIIFSFDGDRAGRKAAWRAMENALPRLSDGRTLKFAFMPDGMDPDSLVAEQGVEAFETCLAKSLPLSSFLIQELSEQVDGDTIEGRAKLAELARPLIAKLPQGVFREALIEGLAETVKLSATKLNAMMGASENTPRRGSSRRKQVPRGYRPTQMRRTITILLHHPEAAAEIDLAQLEGLQKPGAQLLRDLLASIKASPNVTPAVLLESWRNHANYEHLARLAADVSEIENQIDPAADLQGHIAKLVSEARSERVEALREKSRDEGLDEKEKQELRQLLVRVTSE